MIGAAKAATLPPDAPTHHRHQLPPRGGMGWRQPDPRFHFDSNIEGVEFDPRQTRPDHDLTGQYRVSGGTSRFTQLHPRIQFRYGKWSSVPVALIR